jgi:predicted GNAT family acetyltransferase
MTTTVVDSPADSRYELVIDGAVAGLAEYRIDGNEIAFTHTEVDTDQRRRGLGGILVSGALDDVRARTGLRVVAACPFVAHWVGEHPDYQDLLER